MLFIDLIILLQMFMKLDFDKLIDSGFFVTSLE